MSPPPLQQTHSPQNYTPSGGTPPQHTTKCVKPEVPTGKPAPRPQNKPPPFRLMTWYQYENPSDGSVPQRPWLALPSCGCAWPPQHAGTGVATRRCEWALHMRILLTGPWVLRELLQAETAAGRPRVDWLQGDAARAGSH